MERLAYSLFGSIKKKLKSNEGASLVFALFLFIVCAVIGSIVLTAGTITSGRLADKAKMDQRYYEVISAAEFLRDEISESGLSVTIERVRVKDSTGSVSYSLTADDSFLGKKTLELLNSNGNDSDMWESDFHSTKETTEEYFLNINIPTANSYKVNVVTHVTLGQMTIDVSNVINTVANEKKEGNTYTVRMTFMPVISEVTSVDGNVEKKIATVKWSLNNMEKKISS